MRSEDVDLLKAFLDEHPELGVRLDLGELAVKLEAGNRIIRGLRPGSRGLTLELVDGGRVELTVSETKKIVRDRFWREFQKLLRCHLPQYRILSALRGTDRVRHQSASVLRFWLASGRRRVAALALSPEDGSSSLDRMFSSLLIWWDHLEKKSIPSRAFLFLPDFCPENILMRLPLLRIPIVCWKYSLGGDSPTGGRLWKIYPGRRVRAEVGAPYVMYSIQHAVPEGLQDLAGECSELDLSFRHGRWELSYLGLPVAWQETQQVCRFNLAGRQILTESSRGLFWNHLRTVQSIRTFPPSEPRHPFYTLRPERWLESLVVRNPELVCRDLRPIVYSEVPSFVQGERKVLDLVSVTRSRRLAVIELKVEKNLDLVFQGFDYWERVALHLKRGDFQRNGYFPGISLSTKEPLLFLVSPLFEFHRILPTLRKYLRSPVRFFCVGINSDWKRGLQLVRRFRF